MARKTKDVFGFEEFEKAMERVSKRYEQKSDAFLVAATQQAAKRVRQKSPRGKKPKPTENERLKKGWRTLRPKEFQSGKVKVSRVLGRANHAHLYENPHKIRTRGRKEWVGVAKGHYILRDTMQEVESRVFKKGADNLLKEIIGDLEV